ncbi:thiamine-phosphate diphosphorylase [Sphingomonas aquatilis]|uniref:Thiamine-phosphate diphosphorylase n=1 Tax=Sphingomonas aquatilis TaxID=93063 RepID=A0AAW3TXI1_9SPHN|nr:thiamine-phosphate diphosphorylase [Sphingomonas aquatilis]
MVQLRDKGDDARRFVKDARNLHELLVPLGIPLVIKDRVDIAAAVGAEGVHLGQSDLPPADARRILGEAAIVGLSVTNEAEAADADPAIVDYLGVGPVFATATKSDAAAPSGPRAWRPFALERRPCRSWESAD